MVDLPHVDARFLHLEEPKALVEYARRMAELLSFWEDKERIRASNRCKSEALDEHDASTEFEVIDHIANRSASFLGSQIILHAWALLEGLVKFSSDFVAQTKGIIDPEGTGPRLSSRESWPKQFRQSAPRDPVDRWGKWFEEVLKYNIPMNATELEWARNLSRVRNSIGHELMGEPRAEAARLARIADQADPAWAELVWRIDPVEAFGSPPGLEWAEQVAKISDSVIARLRADFPVEPSGFHFWSRPPLATP